MSDEMKKWMPYKSIVEQESYLESLLKEKDKIEKPQISEEEAEIINRILVSYKNELLKIKFFDNGKIKEKESTLFRIDSYQKLIYFSKYERIKFNQLISLSYI